MQWGKQKVIVINTVLLGYLGPVMSVEYVLTPSHLIPQGRVNLHVVTQEAQGSTANC